MTDDALRKRSSQFPINRGYRKEEDTLKQASPLNLEQFVEGRRWWPWAREGIAEVRVFAGDEPCHREGTGRAARFYTLQSVIN